MNAYMKYRIIKTTVAVAAVLLFILLSTAHGEVHTDEIGRIVALPSHPERIVSLAPGITEILFAIGLGDRTAGVTTFSDYPEAARSKPKVGSFVNISLERVVSLVPDLVIATADGNRKDIVEQLEEIEVPVYVINPGSFEDIFETILHIGTITGREKQAETLVSRLRDRVDAVVSLTEHREKPRVFIQIGSNPVVTAGGNTLCNRLIELAGGVNIYGDVKIRYPRCGIEDVIARKPDFIIISSMEKGEDFSRVKSEWLRWKHIPAVAGGRIHIIDSDLIDRSSPRIVDGLEEIVGIIHPEVENPCVATSQLPGKD